MAKFIYKMQSILNIKYKIEEQVKLAYSEASFRLQEEEKKLQELQDKRLDYEDKLRTIISSVLDVFKIKECENAIETIKFTIKMQILEVKKAEQNLEIVRKRLNEVMIDRKTHEKLRENAFDNFLIELGIEERKEIDELVSFKYNTPVGSEEEA